MHKLFLNCTEFMCDHNWIVVLAVTLTAFFLCWKMTKDAVNGVMAGYIAYSIICYYNAGVEITILVIASLYVVGMIVVLVGVPASLFYLLYLARSRRGVKKSAKLAKAVAHYILPLASVLFFLSLAGCGNDEETLVVLIYTVYVGVWTLIILTGLTGLYYMVKAVCWFRRRVTRKIHKF